MITIEWAAVDEADQIQNIGVGVEERIYLQKTNSFSVVVSKRL